jgi:glucose-6-phosphate dehydrogenase assembly protein OpcA
LTRGDVPTAVWWPADVSQWAPPAAITDTGRQLIYDSAAWRDIGAGARAAAAVIESAHSPDLADVNWQRLAPLRHAVVHALRNERPSGPLTSGDLHITHRPGDAAAAWLLAAWFTTRLPDTFPKGPTVEEARRGDEVLTVRLESGGWTVTASLSRQRVKVKSGSAAPAFRMPVPRVAPADAVVNELRSLGHDAGLRLAVTALAKLHH